MFYWVMQKNPISTAEVDFYNGTTLIWEINSEGREILLRICRKSAAQFQCYSV